MSAVAAHTHRTPPDRSYPATAAGRSSCRTTGPWPAPSSANSDRQQPSPGPATTATRTDQILACGADNRTHGHRARPTPRADARGVGVWATVRSLTQAGPGPDACPSARSGGRRGRRGRVAPAGSAVQGGQKGEVQDADRGGRAAAVRGRHRHLVPGLDRADAVPLRVDVGGTGDLVRLGEAVGA